MYSLFSTKCPLLLSLHQFGSKTKNVNLEEPDELTWTAEVSY